MCVDIYTCVFAIVYNANCPRTPRDDDLMSADRASTLADERISAHALAHVAMFTFVHHSGYMWHICGAGPRRAFPLLRSGTAGFGVLVDPRGAFAEHQLVRGDQVFAGGRLPFA